jgi:hypothetical protein
MATTKRLVEAHGGTIAVKSALGAGTQVTVKFPLAAPAPEVQNPKATPSREEPAPALSAQR